MNIIPMLIMRAGRVWALIVAVAVLRGACSADIAYFLRKLDTYCVSLCRACLGADPGGSRAYWSVQRGYCVLSPQT